MKPFLLRPTSLSAALLAIPPLCAEEIIRIDQDNFFSDGNFSFGYAGYGTPDGENIDVGNTITQFSEVLDGIGVGESFAYQFTGDTTATKDALVEPNNYTYMGFGIGFTSNLIDPLPTGDLERYSLEVALKASGLLDGSDQTAGLVDVRFIAPDGTLQPDDDDTDGDILFTARYSSAVFAEADFFANEFRLNRPYEVRQGSLENFQTHFAAVAQIQTIIEMNNAIGDYGFDTDNIVIVDDLVLTENAPPLPPAENPIVTIDFDDNPRFYGGSYYAFAGVGANGVDTSALTRSDDVIEDPDAGPSFVQSNCLDTSPWADADPLNGEGYLGFAGSAAIQLDGSTLPSSDPADYKISFDAKATGFLAAPGGKYLVELQAPDDTLSPADGDTNNDIIIRFRIANDRGFGLGFNLEENFTNYSYNLGDAEVDGGSLEQFANFKDLISIAQFTLEAVTNSENTDFDNDNCLAFDNAQLIHLTPPPTNDLVPQILSITAVAPEQVTLTFQSTPGRRYGILATADLSGTFSEIDEVTATETVTTFTSNNDLLPREFFRIEDRGLAE